MSEKRKPKAIDAEETVNPVLARLIEEVRNEGAKGKTAYDRVHNRHNR
ncbi:MAG: XRE family transcriptional regulator [Chloroflexi bacterium]|nr:XRE family transcriptional regulator [Chloroflexota bacterium]